MRFGLVILTIVFVVLGQVSAECQNRLPPCPDAKSAFRDNCYGTHAFPSGTKYIGEFRNGKFNGQGTYTFPDGRKYVGEFRDDLPNGQGVYTSPNGEKKEGYWVSGEYYGSTAPAEQDTLKNVTLDRVVFVTSQKWYLLREKAIFQNTLMFKKYSFLVIDGKQHLEETKDLKNIMSYGCQRTNRDRDYIVFHLPSLVHLNGIEPDGWISQLDLHILADKFSFTAVGEFHNRELFIDFNDDFGDKLLKLIVSDKIIVEFGPKSERITVQQMYRTPSGGNVVGFLDNAVTLLSSALGGGKVESLETETILQKCLAFKRTGKF